jgi:hypothetical protein
MIKMGTTQEAVAEVGTQLQLLIIAAGEARLSPKTAREMFRTFSKSVCVSHCTVSNCVLTNNEPGSANTYGIDVDPLEGTLPEGM